MAEIDALGHYTRFSDSSFYDERCIFCGATDGYGDRGLRNRCPNTPKPGDSWRDVSFPMMPAFIVERDFFADPPLYRWREGHWPRPENEVVEWSYTSPPPNSHFA